MSNPPFGYVPSDKHPAESVSPANNTTDCPTAITGCEKGSAEYYGYLYFYTPINLVGILLNSFNLAILTRTRFKGCSSTFTFLTGMAVADFMFACIGCPIGIVRCAEPNDERWQYISRQIYEIYIYLPVINMFAASSVWITTAVAVERYITVAHLPLAQRLCTRTKAKVVIGVIYAVAVIFHLPYFFYKRVNWAWGEEEEGDVLWTDFSQTAVFHGWMYVRIAVVKYVPIAAVIVFNCLLLAAVYRINRRQRTLVAPASHNGTASASAQVWRRQQQQNKCTVMLLSITATFLLCHLLEPLVPSYIYSSIFGPCSLYEATYRNLVMCVNTLEAASFASNFVFYCVFNGQFADGVKRLVRCELGRWNGATTEPPATSVVLVKP